MTSPYATALAVQDASNLSGVAHTFVGEVLPALWQEARDHGHGTDYVARHPVTLLFLDKMASLAGTHIDADLSLAWQQCREEVAAESGTPRLHNTYAERLAILED